MKETTFYQRQMILKDIGKIGQEKLKSTSVLIVGAGGLGHPVASYLAASGVGKIKIADFDTVEESNLHRQVLFNPSDIGYKKADILSKRIKKQNPFIEVQTIIEKITAENINLHLSDIHIIIDCCDNFKTKFLLHDSAYLLNIDLVQASIYQMEGQLQVFAFRSHTKKSGCMRCLWPKMPRSTCVGNCATAGVIGAVAGVLGTLQAMEVIKLICQFGEIKHTTTTTLNLLNLQINSIKWQKNPDCPLCSDKSFIDAIKAIHYEENNDFEITIVDNLKYTYIDLREDSERIATPVNFTSENYSFKTYNQWKGSIDDSENIVFVCQKGFRSLEIASRFRESGYHNCFSFKGGVSSVQQI